MKFFKSLLNSKFFKSAHRGVVLLFAAVIVLVFSIVGLAMLNTTRGEIGDNLRQMGEGQSYFIAKAISDQFKLWVESNDAYTLTDKISEMIDRGAYVGLQEAAKAGDAEEEKKLKLLFPDKSSFSSDAAYENALEKAKDKLEEVFFSEFKEKADSTTDATRTLGFGLVRIFNQDPLYGQDAQGKDNKIRSDLATYDEVYGGNQPQDYKDYVLSKKVASPDYPYILNTSGKVAKLYFDSKDNSSKILKVRAEGVYNIQKGNAISANFQSDSVYAIDMVFGQEHELYDPDQDNPVKKSNSQHISRDNLNTLYERQAKKFVLPYCFTADIKNLTGIFDAMSDRGWTKYGFHVPISNKDYYDRGYSMSFSQYKSVTKGFDIAKESDTYKEDYLTSRVETGGSGEVLVQAIDTGSKGKYNLYVVDNLDISAPIFVEGEGNLTFFVRNRLNIGGDTPYMLFVQKDKGIEDILDPTRFTIIYSGDQELIVDAPVYINAVIHSVNSSITINAVPKPFSPKRRMDGNFRNILKTLNDKKKEAYKGGRDIFQETSANLKGLQDISLLNGTVSPSITSDYDKALASQPTIRGALFSPGDITITGDNIDMNLVACAPLGNIRITGKNTHREGAFIAKRLYINKDSDDEKEFEEIRYYYKEFFKGYDETLRIPKGVDFGNRRLSLIAINKAK